VGSERGPKDKKLKKGPTLICWLETERRREEGSERKINDMLKNVTNRETSEGGRHLGLRNGSVLFMIKNRSMKRARRGTRQKVG